VGVYKDLSVFVFSSPSNLLPKLFSLLFYALCSDKSPNFSLSCKPTPPPPPNPQPQQKRLHLTSFNQVAGGEEKSFGRNEHRRECEEGVRGLSMRNRHLLLCGRRGENFNEFKMLLIVCLQSNGKRITTRIFQGIFVKRWLGEQLLTDFRSTDPLARERPIIDSLKVNNVFIISTLYSQCT